MTNNDAKLRNEENEANASQVNRLIRCVDEYMWLHYRKSLYEMEISETPGYWRDKEAAIHPGHPLHGCVGCTGPFKATYTYFDRGRECGRFISPTRTWKIIKANTLKRLVGCKFTAADKGDYGIYVVGCIPEKNDLVVMEIGGGTVRYDKPPHRLDVFKASYRYILDSPNIRNEEPASEPSTNRTPLLYSPFFVFDVESIGLHGEAFAVAGGVYINGIAQSEFRFSCLPGHAAANAKDSKWVETNVPTLEITHQFSSDIREAFWNEWELAKAKYPGITMAGECIWPVETGFVSACIRQEMAERKWSGPYPFHEIASIMLAAGMDPMATYERMEPEKPAHDPLADARQSARLLATALRKLINK